MICFRLLGAKATIQLTFIALCVCFMFKAESQLQKVNKEKNEFEEKFMKEFTVRTKLEGKQYVRRHRFKLYYIQ